MSGSNGQPQPAQDSIRLMIKVSSSELCVARGVHQSGGKPRSISVTDELTLSDRSGPAGYVTEATRECLDNGVWLYQVSYRPIIADGEGNAIRHPLGHHVLFTEPELVVEQPKPRKATRKSQSKSTKVVADRTATPVPAAV